MRTNAMAGILLLCLALNVGCGRPTAPVTPEPTVKAEPQTVTVEPPAPNSEPTGTDKVEPPAQTSKPAAVKAEPPLPKADPTSTLKIDNKLDAKPAGRHRLFTNTLGMEFALVPKGRAWLGGGGGKPGNREVAIPDDFYLGVYEVTQEEWQQVMGDNPSYFSRQGKGQQAVKAITDADLRRFPVEWVTWENAQEFSTRLNEKAKAAGWLYRLPTEVEWEYACRGGPMTDRAESAFYFYGENPTNELLPAQANSNASDLKRPCKVGSYAPNRLGLHDMHGNVREWCANELPDSKRVFRGGSCLFDTAGARATFRFVTVPSYRHRALGLRLARVASGKEPLAAPPAAEKASSEPTGK